MADDLVETTEALAVKEQLLAEIRKTALGRYLLDDLERRKVTLVLSDDMSCVAEGSGQAGAYWDPKTRRVVLSPDVPMAKLLHYFAHETRHSAQFDVDMTFPGVTEALHPVNFVLANRLHEMDADAFAVFFVTNHAIEAKSTYFNDLAQSERHSGGLFGDTEQKIDRSQMYTAFHTSWHENGHDAARAMRDAAAALFEEPRINEFYDERCAALWNEKIFPRLVEASKNPRSEDAQRLKKIFRNFRDGKFESPQENLEAHAKAYSRIFVEGGSPDYLSAVAGKVFTFLAEDSTGAQNIWSKQMPGMKDKFNEACDYYCDKLGKKKPAAAPKKSRAQAFKKAA